MKKRTAIWVVGGLLLLLVAGVMKYAQAQTDCPGDGTNSTVVGEYVFNEGSGTSTINYGTDLSAGNATLTNGVTFSTNVTPVNTACGWSINLPATGSGSLTPAVETSASYDPLAGATNFTLMAWVKRESAASNQNTSARVVSDESNTTLASNSGFAFRFSGSAGTLALRINDKELTTTVGGIAPNEGTWHHVAVVYEGSRPATNELTRHAHFYVDGIQRGVGVSNATRYVSVNANTSRLTIGNSAVGRTIDNVLVGKIDDMRILRGFSPNAVGNGKTNDTILCYMQSNDYFVPPIIACPPSMTVTADGGHNYASNVNLGQPTVSTNCGIAVVTNNAPTQFPVGAVGVVWLATDVAGNSSTCTQSVTVVANNFDSVGDGIPDWWRALYFGGNGTTTNSQSCAWCDPDNDGYSNRQEFHFETDPTDPDLHPAEIAAGLVGWWKLDEGFGLMASDSSGNDRTGLLSTNPSPTWVSGVLSNALRFAGTNDSVTVAHDPGLNLTNGLSISLWLYLEQLPTQSAALLSKGGGWGNVGFQLNAYDIGPVARFELDNWPLDSWTILSTGVWYQIICTWDGYTMRMYINGELDAEDDYPWDIGENNFPISIGRILNPEHPRSVNGTLDDVRLYSRALSTEELAALIDSDGDGLPDWWEMQYFGNLNQTAAGDYDGDGVNNLTEYLQGRDPTKGAVADTAGLVNLNVYTPLE